VWVFIVLHGIVAFLLPRLWHRAGMPTIASFDILLALSARKRALYPRP
jgi:uncharacterized protein YjeT (DUF2065 family)